ncbi:tetratricopeptide repeat-containing sensor histidine kinase [uncultured Flavobacterium sp.]|uniref:sensor histidine kinase n=1 Tax=uncultured Flavobacterium sp. TaxID=165435 RepID=UPI0025984959|nr:tetratricopeptide repeat-containing sensor histidine kinase [uncultured Flavobacterium sp.]
MKTQFKLVLSALFLFFSACNSDRTEEIKKNINIAFKTLDSSDIDNGIKEKIVDTLYRYALNHMNDSINRDLYFKIASKYYSFDKYSKFLSVVKKVNSLSIKAKDNNHIAKSLYFFGDYFEAKSQSDSAFSYYLQSEKVYSRMKDTLNIGRTKLYKAGILLDSGIYSESEIQAIDALRLLKTTNDPRLVYECYIIVAISLKELNHCLESLKYFDLALKQLDLMEEEDYAQEKIIKSRISCLNNMGRVFEKLKNFPEAIRLYKRGLQTKKIKQNYPKLYAMLLDNLAYSKMKTANFDHVHDYLFESLKIMDSLNLPNGVASSKINIGEYYIYKKNKTKALAYLKEGFLLSKKINSSQHVIESLKLLMENDIGNINYTAQYFKINDSLLKVERDTRDKFARIAYETDLVEKNNAILSRRNNNIIIGSAVIIIFLIGFLVIYRLKIKNKELFFIKEQQDANEKIYQLMISHQSETEMTRKEERNRIAMELHDGIVNNVFTIRFNLMQLDSNKISKKEQLVKELEKTENEIRKISHDLTENLQFEDKGFPEIVKNLVESQQNQYNTKFDVTVDPYINWSSISTINKIQIYRIIQEGLQNSNKHSQAKRCYIMLLKTGDMTTIRIWDNGIGFNAERTKFGIGLKNIQERSKILKGELKITSAASKGTTIEVIF